MFKILANVGLGLKFHTVGCLDSCAAWDAVSETRPPVPALYLKHPHIWHEHARVYGCPVPRFTSLAVAVPIRCEASPHLSADPAMQTMPQLVAGALCVPCMHMVGTYQAGTQLGPIKRDAKTIIAQVLGTEIPCSRVGCKMPAHFWGFKAPANLPIQYKEHELHGPGAEWPDPITNDDEYNYDPQIIAIRNS